MPEIASLLCSRVLLCKYRKVEKSEIDRKEVLLPCATDKSDLLQSYLNTQVSSVIDANSLQTQKTNVGSMAEPLMAIPKIEHKTKLQSLQIYLDPSSKISKVVIIPLPSTLNPFAPEYINFSTPKNQTPTRPYTMYREEVGRNSTNTAPVQSGNSPNPSSEDPLQRLADLLTQRHARELLPLPEPETFKGDLIFTILTGRNPSTP